MGEYDPGASLVTFDLNNQIYLINTRIIIHPLSIPLFHQEAGANSS